MPNNSESGNNAGNGPDSLEKALTPKPLIFGLTVGNIPTMNLRFHYARDRELVFAERLA